MEISKIEEGKMKKRVRFDLDQISESKESVDELSHSDLSESKIDLSAFPNSNIYFKLVAKVGDKLYSIYDSKVFYHMGHIMNQKALPNHKVCFSICEKLINCIGGILCIQHNGRSLIL
jgi:hypothetical protein